MRNVSFSLKKISSFFLVLILLSIIVVGCQNVGSLSPDNLSWERGELILDERLYTFSPEQLNQLLISYDIPLNVTPSYSVKVIKIIYQTVDAKNNKIFASGVIIIPVSNSRFPLISLQHGTIIKRDRVASKNLTQSMEGMIGIILSSLGYVVLVPDYIGLGSSTEMHPYIHAKSLSTCVIDFIRVGNNYCNGNLNDQLFLGGYSEGGYVTLATQREIEQYYSDEFTITATAPMAGPYDLKGTMNEIFSNITYDWPAYIAFFITAYNDIYSWGRLNEIFKSPYNSQMTSLFNGNQTLSEVNNQLPTNLSELLNSEFITNVLNEYDADFLVALEENSLLDWTPVAPIRFYHGDNDSVSPYQNALTAVDSLIANGGSNIELITIPGGTHESSALPAILDMINWIENIQGNSLITMSHDNDYQSVHTVSSD